MSASRDTKLNPAPTRLRQRWLDWVLIGLFTAVLLVPLLDQAFHFDPTRPPSENRVLAECPPAPASLAGLQKFMAGWEAYFNDHFGFRRCLVMWHNKMMWNLFEDRTSRNVLLGTAGWFYITEAWMIEHFRGALQFTDADMQGWQKLLERRRDWLAARGFKYVFVLAPDKQSVYPEYLPAWLKDLGGRTKVDQFVAYMKAHSTVTVVDLRPPLIAGKKIAPTYQKTDTHWNQFGAFLACQEVLRVMREEQLPALPLLSADSFIRTNLLMPGGDLVNLRGIRLSMAESNGVHMLPKPGLPPVEKSIPPLGPHVKDMATAKNPQAHGRAMVYTDSFGRGWIPFFGYEFAESDFFWQYPLDGREVEQRKPDVVVTEILERFFNITDPKELSAQDTLP
jgi:hypothetical protein